MSADQFQGPLLPEKTSMTFSWSGAADKCRRRFLEQEIELYLKQGGGGGGD